MQRKFEEEGLRLNGELEIVKVNREEAEKMGLGALYMSVQKKDNMIFPGGNYYFLGRFPKREELAGFVSLGNSWGLQVVSMLTHPNYRNLGVSRTLLKSAIDFAYEDPKIKGLYATVRMDGPAEKVIRHLGFRYHSRRVADRRNVVYLLDTTNREPRVSYTEKEQIDSGLTKVLEDLKVPRQDIPGLFVRINWCNTALTASVTFGEEHNLRRSDAEAILSRHFKESCIYPPQDYLVSASMINTAGTIWCVDADLLGPKHMIALEDQKVYFNRNNDIPNQFAVIRPFEDEEDLFTISLYEMHEANEQACG